MAVVASHQTKREFCIAIRNRELNANNCCPANYIVEYDRGWFFVQYGAEDGCSEQRPDLTKEVDDMMREETHHVGYIGGAFNTYVLLDGPHPDSPAYDDYHHQIGEVYG